MDDNLLRKGPQEFFNLLMQEDEKREQVMSNLFARELALADKALKLQLQGFKTICEDDTGATFNVAIQQLLTRLFNHQLAARKLLLMGYITEAASVLARAIETSWLARYFECYPDEIKRWGKEREEIRPGKTREGLKRACDERKTQMGSVDQENSLYKELCQIGHPDFYGSIWHTKVESESPPQIGLTLGGYAKLEKPELLRETFKWLLKVQMVSIVTMAAVHNEFLGNNPVWDADGHSLIKSLAECLE